MGCDKPRQLSRTLQVETASGNRSRDCAWFCEWSPDGEWLAVCVGRRILLYRGGTLEQWEGPCMVLNEDGDHHSRSIRSLAFSPSSRYLASCGFDGKVCIWYRRDRSFSRVACLEGHESEVKSVSWHPQEPILATCGRDKSVWIWYMDDAMTDSMPDTASSDGGDVDFQCLAILQEHEQDVKVVRWHPNGSCLLSAGYDDTIRVWISDEDTSVNALGDGDDGWHNVQVLQGHQTTVWSLAFPPLHDTQGSASRFWSSDGDGTINEWHSVRSGNIGRGPQFQLRHSWSGLHNGPIYSIACSPCGRWLASCGGDNRVCVWQLPLMEGNPVLLAEGEHQSDANAVCWYPGRTTSFLSSCGDDGNLVLWKIPTSILERSNKAS